LDSDRGEASFLTEEFDSAHEGQDESSGNLRDTEEPLHTEEGNDERDAEYDSGDDGDEEIENVYVNMADISEAWTIKAPGKTTVVDQPLRFVDRIQHVGASWEASVKESVAAKRVNRARILLAAGIEMKDLDRDPHRKIRVEAWIRSISADQNQRRSRLSARRRGKEDAVLAPHELIGRLVRERELAWYASPIHNPDRVARPNDETPPERPRSLPQGSKREFQSPAPKQSPPSGEQKKRSRHNGDTTGESTNTAIVAVPTSEMSVREVYNLPDRWEKRRDFSRQGGEVTFNREHWHELVLRYYARKLQEMFPCSDDEEVLSRKDATEGRFKMEKDRMIPLPSGFRKLWYSLQDEVRRFHLLGLLIPTCNSKVGPSERWRNLSHDEVRVTSPRVCTYMEKFRKGPIGDILIEWRNKHIFPNVNGHIKIVPRYKKAKRLQEDIEVINTKFDKWYWNLLQENHTKLEDFLKVRFGWGA
jgi:hypothetical protein